MDRRREHETRSEERVEQINVQPPYRHGQPFDRHKKNQKDIPSECGEFRQFTSRHICTVRAA